MKSFSPENPAFRQALLRLLDAGPGQEDRLLAEFENYGRQGHPVYSSLVYILTHLTFTELEAQRHWRRIFEHREELRAGLGRDVGLRVALLDYFVNVSQELKNPKVIEISIYERTQRSAVTDALTGLYNHAYFVQALKREVQRARRHQLLLSLVMLDIDDFKRLNDTRGHLEGDRVLMKVAALISESLREIDLAARYGGEEFAVILPETSRTGAYVVADRIRARVESYFTRRHGPQVTLSGGVATYAEDASGAEELIRRADEALYRSKAEGKNRMTMSGRERRRHRRVSVSHPLTLTAPGRRGLPGVSKNVSEGGLLVSLRQAVVVGTQVRLVLRPSGAGAVTLQGEVVRADRVAGDPTPQHELGVRLLGAPAEGRGLETPRRRDAPAPRAVN